MEIGAVALLTGALMGLAALVAARYREFVEAGQSESLQPIPVPIEDERPAPRR